jgi:hypothetical protein
MAGTITYNGQEYSRESDIGKLAAQFEQPGYRPDAPQNAFPRMMYRAFVCADGIARADAENGTPRHMFPNDQAYEASLRQDEAFNAKCRQIIGQGPDGKPLDREICLAQHRAALESGWRDSAEEAIALVRHRETVVAGGEHMKRLKRDQGMSEAAKAEAAEFDASVPYIVTEIPEARKVKQSDVVMVAGEKKEHWKTRQARERKAGVA